jgi:hypothetical protein
LKLCATLRQKTNKLREFETQLEEVEDQIREYAESHPDKFQRAMQKRRQEVEAMESFTND